MKCLSELQLREAMIQIARSKSDNADHLRHLAAKALHCGVQPQSLADAMSHIANLQVTDSVIVTACQILNDNTKYVLPRIYTHGENKIAFSWQFTPDVETLLIVGKNCFEMLKISNDSVSLHRAMVGYSYGALDDAVGKYIPMENAEG